MENNKIMAAISYIWILFLVPLFAAKDDAFARFHANQGLLLFLASIVLGIIGVIPVIGTIIALVGGIVTFVFIKSQPPLPQIQVRLYKCGHCVHENDGLFL